MPYTTGQREVEVDYDYSASDPASSSTACHTLWQTQCPDPRDGIDTPKDRLKECLLPSNIPPVILDKIITWHLSEVSGFEPEDWFERVQMLIKLIATSPNPKFTAAGIAFASGIKTINGMRMADYARVNGVKRNTIAWHKYHWLKLFPSLKETTPLYSANGKKMKSQQQRIIMRKRKTANGKTSKP